MYQMYSSLEVVTIFWVNRVIDWQMNAIGIHHEINLLVCIFLQEDL